MAVYVVHGDRGGTGKSMFACTLGEYVLRRNLPLVVVDSDTQNSDVEQYFDGSGPALHQIDLRPLGGWRELLTLIAENTTADVLVNLPAGIGGVFAARFGDLVTVCRELERTLGVFFVLNRTPHSVALLGPVLKACVASAVPLVTVRNLYFGDAPKFTRWNESKTRKAHLDAGFLEFDLEELDAPLVDATFGNLPPRRFSANGESGLTYGERFDLAKWLQRQTVKLDGLAPKVGVGKW